jgi:Asp-tRNA(Asn)/Glu-tRNA(Gln) amidotransferase C subunit
MDKEMEKLMHIKTDKNHHVSTDTVFEMCCKINEIIGYLNQSNKQSTEVTKLRDEDIEYLERQRKKELEEGIAWIKQREKKVPNGKVKPEWQEGWREIDKDIRYEIGGKRYVSINGEEYVRTKDISKLLSERQQKGWMEGFDEGTSLEKELSNLLKVEK